MCATGQPANNKRCADKAFTLVELILVMTILTIAVAVASPSMSNFFRGRKQDSEAHRILSLIRYGQSRAVAEAVPVVLWVDVKERTYGLEQDPTYVEDDPKAVECDADPALTIDVEANRSVPRQKSRTIQSPNVIIGGRSLPAIRFLPDGSFAPTSLTSISVSDGSAAIVWIVQSQNGLAYELQNENSRVHAAFR